MVRNSAAVNFIDRESIKRGNVVERPRAIELDMARTRADFKNLVVCIENSE